MSLYILCLDVKMIYSFLQKNRMWPPHYTVKLSNKKYFLSLQKYRQQSSNSDLYYELARLSRKYIFILIILLLSFYALNPLPAKENLGKKINQAEELYQRNQLQHSLKLLKDMESDIPIIYRLRDSRYREESSLFLKYYLLKAKIHLSLAQINDSYKILRPLNSYSSYLSRNRENTPKIAEALYYYGIVLKKLNRISNSTEALTKAYSLYEKYDKNKFVKGKLFALLEISDNYEQQNNPATYRRLVETEISIQNLIKTSGIINDPVNQNDRFQRILSFYDKIQSAKERNRLSKAITEVSSQYLDFTIKQNDIENFKIALENYIKKNSSFGLFDQVHKRLHKLSYRKSAPIFRNKEVKRAILNRKMLFLVQTGHYQAAISDAKQLLGSYQAGELELIRVHLNLGHIYFLQNRYVDASEYYQRTLRLILSRTPNALVNSKDSFFPYEISKSYLYYLLALSSFKNENFKEAKEYLVTAEKNNASDNLNFRISILKSFIYYLDNDQKNVEATLKTIRFEKNFRSLYLFPQIQSQMELIYALPDKKRNQIQQHLNRAQYLNKKRPASFFDCLENLAKAKLISRNQKLEIHYMDTALSSCFRNASMDNWNSIYFFPIPSSIIFKSLNFALENSWQRKKYGNFIVLAELLKRLQKRTFFQSLSRKDLESKKTNYQQRIYFEQFQYFQLYKANFFASELLREKKSAIKIERKLKDDIKTNHQEIVSKKAYIDELIKEQKKDNQLFSSLKRLSGNLERLIHTIPSKEAWIYYHTIKNRLFRIAFFDGKTDSKIISQDAAKTFALADKMIKNILDPNSTDYKATASQLFKSLLGNLTQNFAQQKTNRIAIMASEGLNFIPFASLLQKNGRFIIDNYETYYIQDLLAYLKSPEKKQSASWQLAAIYNPDLDNFSRDLDYTKTEIDLIQSLFAKKTLVEDDDATVEKTLKALDKNAVWHIALPGYLDLRSPKRSFFYTATDNKGENRLFLHDLMKTNKMIRNIAIFSNLELNLAQNASLRSDTAKCYLSYVMKESGFQQYIISTRPSDKDIAVFISAFYRKMRRVSTGDALRQSQLRIKQRNEHPYYWANFFFFSQPYWRP